MNILLIGSGGREHAIAWKINQSSKLKQLYVLPGNAGTSEIAETVNDISAEDHQAVIKFCKEKMIDLVIVGPEVPLAAGIVDSLSAEGIRCFGPTQAAAQIEASKVFSKNFMARHNIPTARYATFTKLDDALGYLDKVDHPIVIKASGLAAGKGVILPETTEEAESTLKSILIEKSFGDAGTEVVIEERLEGQEVSLMAFTDGTSIVPMLPAQDHKRLLDGDRGPNTGGMGAYAPAPIFTKDLMNEALKSVLKPAIDGMRTEGNPFVGVLYAGLILTGNGISVLEFNGRFGDPETQVVLPLLETDLVEILNACIDGNLKDLDIAWKNESAVCVVLASKGYPEKVEVNKLVTFGNLPDNVVCFHAGTANVNKRVLTCGGRVFGLTAWAGDIQSAINAVYSNTKNVSFDGMQYRTDIAHRALKGSK
ncbi:MAG: phosphoribosylamine--glycine ligase [Anaerolineales bacterium]|nr:phosphoribosylamine--glycine ligase [Anaerolineales bacterium]